MMNFSADDLDVPDGASVSEWKPRVNFSGAIACAKAAARTAEAMQMHCGRMTPAQRNEVSRRLRSLQDWRAANLWDFACEAIENPISNPPASAE